MCIIVGVSELLFYAGIAIMIFSVVAGVIAAVVLRRSRHRLDDILTDEYGEQPTGR